MDGGCDDIAVTSVNRKCSAVTGSARKIKDNAADWHNLLLRWERLNEDGFTTATNITDITLTSSGSQNHQLLLDKSPSPPSVPSASSPALQHAAATLQDECCKLKDIVDKMVVVVMKMERLMTSQRGVHDLEEFQFGPEGRKFPLFHSWNSKHFSESSRVLLDTFWQELRLKQTILQELAHTMTSDLCLVYLSCWLHQPLVPPQTRLMLEALLLETGHRPL
ncbi:cyclin-dependent kinase 2-interacting protein isoform X2 [Centropristis striata]|uniref:cyclin-dependent kinase 2-interacting protein isoform X2 n=1 Tax=Centropristis striata TaxID=184440 RepID=UPI0027E14A53|nr:cyclin-dependent kinase 2-interacting protein isoform X2 [Centropristis striata]